MLGISKSRAAQSELRAELQSGIRGEVHVDQMTRGLYATDASIHQLEPVGVVIARDAGDIVHAMKIAQHWELKVLARGGGTSLAGQATGRALIIDTSKYMRAILEVNTEERWARVEPGRVRDELNAQIAPTGLHFAPETATSNRANIGGMIGNNSSGTKSIVYGKTVDHVLELDLLLPTGERLHARPMSREEWNRIAAQEDREGEIYRTVRDVVEANREHIAERYPKVMRRVGGYNLDEFGPQGTWNLSKLVTGSEGTLCVVLEAKLNLEPLPRAKACCAVHFRQLTECLRAVEPIVHYGPSAVEMLDRTVIDMAKDNLETARMCDWIEDKPGAVLIVEFFGDTMEEVEAKLDETIGALRSTGFGYAWPKMLGAAAQEKVWGVRAAGLGLMLGMKGDAKPTAFIEDAAVPVERLAEYIGEVLEVCESEDVPVAMYAHASVGLIHVRPILNLKQGDQVERMKTISAKTFELVQKYGGSWSGEHGDGLVRSYMNERFFGPEIYAAFKAVKRAFDPEGMMNPGKIVHAEPMGEDLRLGPQYRAAPMRTHYRFRAEGGFAQAVEMCTGVGACRKILGGTMCPSYIATRDEAHSTRGRANALRLAMTGQLGTDGMTSRALHDVMDLCLGCKGCKAECPSNVDLASLKGEFLSGYHDAHGATLGERFFSRGPDAARRLAGRLAPLANWMGEHKLMRAAMERLLGLDRRRPLPTITSEPLAAWFSRRSAGADLRARRVILFDDTYMRYHEPRIGRAAVVLLERLGYRVQLAAAGCCGRPLLSMGFLKEAKARGLSVMQKINGYLLDDLPVVVLEPSCASALTDDLPDMIENQPLARRVAKGVLMIDVFLEREVAEGRLDPERLREATMHHAGVGSRFLIHGHCHQKALYGTGAMKRLLGTIQGADVEEIDSGCCGMAGSFGYEKPHYELSLKIGEDRLFPAVREMAEGTHLIACGFSCRHQISDALGVKARHWVEVMAGGE